MIFAEDEIVGFARRLMEPVVGSDCRARFFLAGGAFKTLLTGRPPRDLDLWAPTERDRDILLESLMRRGRTSPREAPFADVFEVGERVVELVHEVGPESLECRLGRFDIALSAIGAEHHPGNRWGSIVHPLARTSVELRQVLLLKPLVNWKYALATLERMRRYAEELGFSVPLGEEAEIWSVFDNQPRNQKQRMLQRYERTGLGISGVREEAQRRMS